MTLLDLSLVTRSLLRLLELHVGASTAWTQGSPPATSARPPDKLTGNSTIGLYLYHIGEDPHYKNLPPPNTSGGPVRFSPMALNLAYLLTAHSDLDSEIGAHTEQLLMGLALKALHDVPVLDDSTAIAGQQVLDAGLRNADNRLRLTLQPVPPAEAVTYWTAGSSPLRLAAYYNASVALLEPDELEVRAGRVLRYNVFAFPAATPRLETSSNSITFTVPGETSPRSVESRPAQVPVDAQVRFIGSGLGGDSLALLLMTSTWDEPVEVGAGDWGVAPTLDGMVATVQPLAAGQPVLPGVYTAQARIRTRRAASGGGTRLFVSESNATPFLVAPSVNSVSGPDANDVRTVDGGSFGLAGPPFAPANIQVYAGETRLVLGTASPLAAGQFAATDPETLTLRLPAGIEPGSAVPLRIIVNGAESPPFWIQL